MSLIITSPLRGWATTLDSVPDPVFAQRMMGDGVAIEPLGDTIVAPFDGEVVTLHDAGHAISLRSAEGAEVLIHIGLDTVMLKGEGFTPLVAIGQAVARGDPLIRFDLDAVALAAPSLITPVIVTNAEAFAISRRSTDCAIGACEALMTLVPVQANVRRSSDDGIVIEQTVKLALPHGIHARPAARIGEAARGFQAELHLLNGDKRGDARSTVALLALGTPFGDEVVVQARGDDAEAALAAIAALLATDMGETAPAAPSAAAIPSAAVPLQAGQIGGVIASPGLAMGPAARLRQAEIAVASEGVGAAEERAALLAARDAVRAHIAARADSRDASIASVMQAHLALIDDPELLAGADRRIAAGRSAGFAWRGAIHDQIDAIRATGNAHLIERIDDLVDIVFAAQLAMLDFRRREWVGRPQANPPAMAGPHQPNQGGDGRRLAQHQPPLLIEIEGEGGEADLKFGCGQMGRAFHVGRCMEDRGCQCAAPGEGIAQDLPSPA